MVAFVSLENIEQFIRVAQANHSPAVELSADQFKLIEAELDKRKPQPEIQLPKRQARDMPPSTVNDDDELMIMEMEAEALELELELLQIKLAA
jgi:hypothetical protein